MVILVLIEAEDVEGADVPEVVVVLEATMVALAMMRQMGLTILHRSLNLLAV